MTAAPESVAGALLQVDPFMQQESKLSGSSLIGFGWSVALSADGTTALIGSPLYNKAWVFTRSGHDLDPAGATARRRRGAQLRHERRAVRRREHGADR